MDAARREDRYLRHQSIDVAARSIRVVHRVKQLVDSIKLLEVLGLNLDVRRIYLQPAGNVGSHRPLFFAKWAPRSNCLNMRQNQRSSSGVSKTWQFVRQCLVDRLGYEAEARSSAGPDARTDAQTGLGTNQRTHVAALARSLL